MSIAPRPHRRGVVAGLGVIPLATDWELEGGREREERRGDERRREKRRDERRGDERREETI